MASGMTSIMAMDRKRVPEKVMARSMTVLLVKQLSEETQLPKMVTSRKRTIMSMILTTRTFPIFENKSI